MAKPQTHICHHCGNGILHGPEILGKEVSCPHCANHTTLGHDYSYESVDPADNPWADEASCEDAELAERFERESESERSTTIKCNALLGAAWGGGCASVMLVWLIWGFASAEYVHTFSEQIKGILPLGIFGIPIILLRAVIFTAGVLLAIIFNPWSWLMIGVGGGIGTLAGWLVSKVWKPRHEPVLQVAIMLLAVGLSYNFIQKVVVDEWNQMTKILAENDARQPSSAGQKSLDS
jgi:hypothetical protein